MKKIIFIGFIFLVLCLLGYYIYSVINNKKILTLHVYMFENVDSFKYHDSVLLLKYFNNNFDQHKMIIHTNKNTSGKIFEITKPSGIIKSNAYKILFVNQLKIAWQTSLNTGSLTNDEANILLEQLTNTINSNMVYKESVEIMYCTSVKRTKLIKK